MKHVPLLRQATAEGWRFVAQPVPDGSAWVLERVNPYKVVETADGVTVYEVARGAHLHDHWSGKVELRFRNGDRVVLEVDGTGTYLRSNGSVRSALHADGKELEYWLDGPRQMHAHWATIVLFDGR